MVTFTTLTKLTEAEIIKGCKDQDRRAQEELFRRYHPDLLGIAIRYCRNREEARDVLQEVMIKIFENIELFRGDCPLFAWMRKIKATVNLIPYNAVAGTPYGPPSRERCEAFCGVLVDRGITATLREERGQDIDAACGQLRSRQYSP